jgi:hypothetical protein
MAFRSDGLVKVRSCTTGSVRLLPIGEWRDATETEVLRRHGLSPAARPPVALITAH